MSASFKLNPVFERKLKELGKTKNIPLPELMPPEFMRANTSFQSVQEMFDKSEFSDIPQEKLSAALQSIAWNAYVQRNTRFTSWQAMINAAGVENFKKRWNAS